MTAVLENIEQQYRATIETVFGAERRHQPRSNTAANPLKHPLLDGRGRPRARPW
jgi:hypothetical protein